MEKAVLLKKATVLLTYIGMLCQGKTQYEAVREMMDDPDYYKYALGISYAIPSAETLRQRFDMIGDSLSDNEEKTVGIRTIYEITERTIDRYGQYHSEIKTDMDVERLPSGKFESNKLVLELTMIAYNIFRIIGQESLKKKDAPGRKKIHRRRIRTMIR